MIEVAPTPWTGSIVTIPADGLPGGNADVSWKATPIETTEASNVATTDVILVRIGSWSPTPIRTTIGSTVSSPVWGPTFTDRPPNGNAGADLGPSAPISVPTIPDAVVETGVDPVTPRFSGVCSAD